jgi:hypothetical protein
MRPVPGRAKSYRGLHEIIVSQFIGGPNHAAGLAEATALRKAINDQWHTTARTAADRKPRGVFTFSLFSRALI